MFGRIQKRCIETVPLIENVSYKKVDQPLTSEPWRFQKWVESF